MTTPTAPHEPAPAKAPGAYPPTEGEETELFGIGKAAARLGVSERALRYYQELGLLTPHGRTPGGMRRYDQDDLARVRRIRELQGLLGLNLDEVRVVLDNEDRIAALRDLYRSSPAGSKRRAQVGQEILAARQELRVTVEAKIASLTAFLSDLDASIEKVKAAIAAEGAPRPAGSPSAPS